MIRLSASLLPHGSLHIYLLLSALVTCTPASLASSNSDRPTLASSEIAGSVTISAFSASLTLSSGTSGSKLSPLNTELSRADMMNLGLLRVRVKNSEGGQPDFSGGLFRPFVCRFLRFRLGPGSYRAVSRSGTTKHPSHYLRGTLSKWMMRETGSKAGVSLAETQFRTTNRCNVARMVGHCDNEEAVGDHMRQVRSTVRGHVSSTQLSQSPWWGI